MLLSLLLGILFMLLVYVSVYYLCKLIFLLDNYYEKRKRNNKISKG